MWSDPRRRNAALRDRLRARMRAQGLPCGICHRAIDYTLPAGDPMSYELDERIPVARGGDPYDWDNLQPAHRICNERKGARLAKPRARDLPRQTSREW